MSFSGAIIAGLVATFVSYVTTRLSTVNQMGMERIFGTMFTGREHRRLGARPSLSGRCQTRPHLPRASGPWK